MSADGENQQPTAALGTLQEQRRALPDQPGSYLFRDSNETVIYVGKANSIRKRVASHFSSAGNRTASEMTSQVAQIDFLVTSTETEALLIEQTLIKRHRPRFNVRLRDDKSYPYVAISLDEEFPRIYFTREKHRSGRVYFGPYSSAKRVRQTLDVLQKVFMIRSCTGSEPGRRSGSPCLDFYIDRCEAPCVGKVTQAQYQVGIQAAIDFLSGRHVQVESEIERRMQTAADAQDYEQAARERNRLGAARSLRERQHVASDTSETFDAVAVAVDGVDANAQVFQVRDGGLADRQSFYLANRVREGESGVLEEFLLQYYEANPAIPPLVVLQQGSQPTGALQEALAQQRKGPVEVRAAERGTKRKIVELAAKNAALALDQERMREQRRLQQRTEALDGLQQVLGMERPPVRIECYDISHLLGTETSASMVVFEGGDAKKADYRRFKVQAAVAGDDFGAIAEVLARRTAQWERHADLSPHEPKYDASFAALPNLIVIDGGKGQLSAGIAELGPLLEQGVTVVSLAKRIEEVFVPGRGDPILLPHSSAPLQLLQRIRDEAHRFAITHHRQRRDRKLTSSALDSLPGVGPARRRALLEAFGTAEKVFAASREQLAAVPGVSDKTAGQIYAYLHRTAESPADS